MQDLLICFLFLFPDLTDKHIRGIMAPKMDYDEWTPLGRGDPLKNDPTFDYSPPMVGKVKYWINPLFRTPDPPIVPNGGGDEMTTETSQLYTATTPATSKSVSSISSSLSPSSKTSTGDIKRFYIDFKDHTASDMTYVQLLNSKYNNKLVRPHTIAAPHQNHYYVPTRQPPPPLPMLVPPPPVEPSSYSSTKIENSTALELSWDIPNKESHITALTTPVSVTTNAGAYFTTSTASAPVEPLLQSTTPMPLPPSPLTTATKVAVSQTRPDAFRTPTTATIFSTSDKSILKNLLSKEQFQGNHRVTSTSTTLLPLTPNPGNAFFTKQNLRPTKTPAYLIIQGHSKVKKYGASKLDRVDVPSLQDTNEINDVVKYELPRDARGGRQLNVEDFLPFNGLIQDLISSQAEGSGIGAELTKALFPAYVQPSTTLQYDEPRGHDNNEDAIDESYV